MGFAPKDFTAYYSNIFELKGSDTRLPYLNDPANEICRQFATYGNQNQNGNFCHAAISYTNVYDTYEEAKHRQNQYIEEGKAADAGFKYLVIDGFSFSSNGNSVKEIAAAITVPENKNVPKDNKPVAATNTATQELYNNAVDFYNQKKYTEAFDAFYKAAQQGHADAQNFLGTIYFDGIANNMQSYPQAMFWYKKAAEQGNMYAQGNLGNMYFEGLGTKQDYVQAFHWCQKAAEQGYASSQNKLGLMYKRGLGVTKDIQKSVQWYQKAAEQGNAAAQNNLGNKYFEGDGLTKDYAKAMEWYQKAATQGNANAQNKLGVMYENGLNTAKDIKQATQWYQKSAAQGNEGANDALKRLGVTQNNSSANQNNRNSKKTAEKIKQEDIFGTWDCIVSWPGYPNFGTVSCKMIFTAGDDGLLMGHCIANPNQRLLINYVFSGCKIVDNKIKYSFAPDAQGIRQEFELIIIDNNHILGTGKNIRTKEIPNRPESWDAPAEIELSKTTNNSAAQNINSNQTNNTQQTGSKWAFAYCVSGYGKCYGYGLYSNIIDISKLPFDFDKLKTRDDKLELYSYLEQYFFEGFEKKYPNCTGRTDIHVIVDFEQIYRTDQEYEKKCPGFYGRPCWLTQQEATQSRQRIIEKNQNTKIINVDF
jgi:TPR repeat protein